MSCSWAVNPDFKQQQPCVVIGGLGIGICCGELTQSKATLDTRCFNLVYYNFKSFPNPPPDWVTAQYIQRWTDILANISLTFSRVSKPDTITCCETEDSFTFHALSLMYTLPVSLYIRAVGFIYISCWCSCWGLVIHQCECTVCATGLYSSTEIPFWMGLFLEMPGTFSMLSEQV